MEIWQMKYFIQVCDDKSLSKAAKSLYISQQGLSKTIKNIEDELQIVLFERSTRGVKLTEHGNMLYEKTQSILNDYEAMIYFFHENKVFQDKTITIGITNILYTNCFGNIIYNFQEEYAGIKLELIELGTYACEKYLSENLMDICFAVKPDNSMEYDFIPISTCRMILLVNKNNELSKQEQIRLMDLKNEKFIMLSSEYKIRKITIDYCQQNGFNPNIVITTSQLEFIIELINLNKGVAILPAIHSAKALKMGEDIATVLFEDSFYIDIGFIINKNKRLNYQTRTFICYIDKIFNGDISLNNLNMK